MNIRSKVAVLVVTLLVTFSLSQTVFAAEEADALAKLKRGAINLTTGWAEVPVKTYEGASSDRPFVGAFNGLGHGIVSGLHRTGLGAWDSATFPVGPYDHPVLDPETIFG